jgi:hypothetical protein
MQKAKRFATHPADLVLLAAFGFQLGTIGMEEKLQRAHPLLCRAVIPRMYHFWPLRVKTFPAALAIKNFHPKWLGFAFRCAELFGSADSNQLPLGRLLMREF